MSTKENKVFKTIDGMRGKIEIPPQLTCIEGARFIKIDKRVGGGKKPAEKGWNKDKNYSAGDLAIQGHIWGGGNYGIATGRGDLCCIDADVFDRLVELGVIAKIPKTFTVRTGRTSSEGRHYWLLVEGIGKIVLYDPVKTEIGKNGKEEPAHLGEIQGMNFYAIGPGSIHKSGRKYEIIDDSPVARITIDELNSIISGLITNETKKTERIINYIPSDQSTVRDDVDITRIAMPSGNVVRRKGPKGIELQGENPLHSRSENGTNFSINTTNNTWFCFRHWKGGGWVELLAIREGICNCGDTLSKTQFRQTMERARQLGLIEERDELTDIPVIDITVKAEKEDADELPDKIPDGNVIELIAPPRTGKTHKVILWLKQAGSGNYITHTHAIAEHAVKIAKEIGISSAVWVIGISQPGACRFDKNCASCPLKPTRETFYQHQREAEMLLRDKGVLTSRDVPKNMCPYMTLKAAEKVAQYAFTVVNNINNITPRTTVILDEEPVLSYFYPGSIEVATMRVRKGESNEINYIDRSVELQSRLHAILHERKKPAFKEYAKKIEEISNIINSRQENETVRNIADKIEAALKDFHPEHREVDTEQSNGDSDLSMEQCVRCLGKLYTDAPVLIMNKRGGYQSIYILGDDSHTAYSMGWMEHAEKVIVIAQTRGKLFIEEFGGSIVEVKKFRYDDRFTVIGVDEEATAGRAKTAQKKKILEIANGLWGTTENSKRIPFLMLTGSKKEQDAVARKISGATRLSNERERGMESEFVSGKPAIFYQNSVISRGLDVDQYNLLLVMSTAFAQPFWSVKDKNVEAAIIADETTNSVLRISPTIRNDEGMMKIIVMPRADIPKIEKYLSNITVNSHTANQIALMLRSINVGGMVETNGRKEIKVVCTGIKVEDGRNRMLEALENVDAMVDPEETEAIAAKIVELVNNKCRRNGSAMTTKAIKNAIGIGDAKVRVALSYIQYKKMLTTKWTGKNLKWSRLGRKGLSGSDSEIER
jgi:hypothetical protein